MNGHSPGPWALMAGMPTNVLDTGGSRVARCDFDGDFDSPEAHANARLIAKAPAMLDELTALRAERAKMVRVLEAAVSLVCAPAWAGVSDEDVTLERVLHDCGFVQANVRANLDPTAP